MKNACPKMCRRFDMKARNVLFKNRCVFRMQTDQNTNFVHNIQDDDETQEKYEKTHVIQMKRSEEK